MSTMQSTIERIADEERKPDPVPGWQPAGPPLTDAVDAMRAAAEQGIREVTQISDVPLGARPSQPIPSIGHMVVYHLRDGDSRNMRTKFPATVLDCDTTTGLLSLIITVDAGDEWRQDRVPPRVAPEPGWELVDGVGLTGEFINGLDVWRKAAFSAIESLEISYTNLESRLNEAEQNIIRITAARAHLLSENAALEDRIAALEAKRGPGRPPKPTTGL